MRLGRGERIGPVDVPRAELGAHGLALHDYAALRLVRCERDRLVEQRLVVDHAGDLDAARRREHDLRLRVVDSRAQLGRGEAPR